MPSPIAAARNRLSAASTSSGRRRTRRPHLMLGTRRALIQRQRRRCEMPRRSASDGMFEYCILFMVFGPAHTARGTINMTRVDRRIKSQQTDLQCFTQSVRTLWGLQHPRHPPPMNFGNYLFFYQGGAASVPHLPINDPAPRTSIQPPHEPTRPCLESPRSCIEFHAGKRAGIALHL